MGKINGCIKCLFIFFNVVFAILGCVLFYLAVQITAFSHQVAALGGPSLAWSWVFALGVLILPVLGIVAACMEKELVLRILQCCGVVSSSDWGMNIPQSCECKMQDKRSLFSSRCKANVGLFGPDQIYATSCSSALFVIANFIFKIVMGICFTFAILALLALLMSVLMIHQIRKHDGGESSMAMQSY
ncbi:uncharacterized protein [Pseudochaenichthys georgianus]|uniref:uncharacterized protein isoform X2 n=1 Tax=Pseudochaenichthys georgianus TaxID=52239 RepID=UPI00146CC3B6|nr:uncharacterized protein LOC117443130 isoform X2 [Pseudochaenichthys georgianus]